jgi:hypothetical protein
VVRHGNVAAFNCAPTSPFRSSDRKYYPVLMYWIMLILVLAFGNKLAWQPCCCCTSLINSLNHNTGLRVDHRMNNDEQL